MNNKVKEIDGKILENGNIKILQPGEILIQKNEVAENIYFVKNGKLIVLEDENHYLVESGSFIDPIPVFNEKVYPFMVIAKSNSEIIYVNYKKTPHRQNLLFLYIQRKSILSEINFLNYE
jgi:hypothetical protein